MSAKTETTLASVTAAQDQRRKGRQREGKQGRIAATGRKTRCVAASVSGLAFCDLLSTPAGEYPRARVTTRKCKRSACDYAARIYTVTPAENRPMNFHVDIGTARGYARLLEKRMEHVYNREKSYRILVSIKIHHLDYKWELFYINLEVNTSSVYKVFEHVYVLLLWININPKLNLYMQKTCS